MRQQCSVSGLLIFVWMSLRILKAIRDIRKNLYYPLKCCSPNNGVFSKVFYVIVVITLICIYGISQKVLSSGEQFYEYGEFAVTKPNNTQVTMTNNTHVKKTVIERDPKKRILLVTYARSGSTFISDLISAHGEVFYTFEPLYETCIKHTGKDLLITDFGIKNRRTTRNMTSFTEEAVDVVRSFLHCNISHLPIHVLRNKLLKVRNSTKPFAICMTKSHSKVQITNCIKDFTKKCNENRISFVKTIRYPTSGLVKEMANDHQLYLLYLVRDPRGIISSQIFNFQSFVWSSIKRVAAEFCNQMEQDIDKIEELQKLYPKRVKILRYESIAFRPISSTKHIYRFIGLNFDQSVRNFINLHTSANLKDDCKVTCTIRGNSKKVPYKWRLRATFKSVDKIDHQCEHVYKKMCYEPVKNLKNLKNMEYPLIKSCRTEGYFPFD